MTWCPYTNQAVWNDALQQTYDVDQQFGLPLSVQFWNLQCYGGGTALKESLSALTSALPVDGFDFDDESEYSAPTDAKFSQVLAGPANFGGLLARGCRHRPLGSASFPGLP